MTPPRTVMAVEAPPLTTSPVQPSCLRTAAVPSGLIHSPPKKLHMPPVSVALQCSASISLLSRTS